MKVSGSPENKKVPQNISSHVHSIYFSFRGFLADAGEIDLEIQISFSRPRSFSTQMLLYNNVCQFTFDMSCAQYRMYLIKSVINNNNMQNTQFRVSWFRNSYMIKVLVLSLLVCREIVGQGTQIRLTSVRVIDNLGHEFALQKRYDNQADTRVNSVLVISNWLVFVQPELDDLSFEIGISGKTSIHLCLQCSAKERQVPVSASELGPLLGLANSFGSQQQARCICTGLMQNTQLSGSTMIIRAITNQVHITLGLTSRSDASL